MLPVSEEFSQAEIGQELLRRKLATESLLNFTTFTKPDYQVNWHHELMFKKLNEFIAGKIKRLIISCPPRNGKSEIVSRRLPAYLFGKIPTSQIIACSYSADLAQRMNRDVQRIIDSPEYHTLFPDVGLNASNVRTTAQGSFLRNSDIFEIVGSSGVYRSSGIGGGITGMGFNFGLIDDYCKNREEAESSTVRDKVYEWYTDVFLTRAEKDASILITATRWHEDDLIGRLLKLSAESQDADQWDVITLPALSEESRPDYDQRTGEDQPLWPDKYPIESLNKIKATVPIYTWLSLYQQRPSAVAGNLVSEANFKYCTLKNGLLTLGPNKIYLLSQCRIFQTCDPAASEKSSADYFALGTWAQTPFNELALIDLVHERLEKPRQLPLMSQQYLNWHPVTQWIATKGLGISLFQDLRANGLPVNRIEEETDKVSRFITACNRITTGTVYFLDNLPHKTEYKEELLTFPNGAHDDLVDITSTAVHVMINYPFDLQSYETSFAGSSFSSGGMRI